MNERCPTTTPHQPHHWIDTDSNGYRCDGRVDVYPVGILWAFKDDQRKGWRRVRSQLTRAWAHVKAGRWHEARSIFNGYLAECPDMDGTHWHNCGRGWTKRAALRRVERLHREQATR